MHSRTTHVNLTPSSGLCRIHPELERIRKQREALNRDLRWNRETGGDNSALLVALSALADEEDRLLESRTCSTLVF
jgi:hypothetical protein